MKTPKFIYHGTSGLCYDVLKMSNFELRPYLQCWDNFMDGIQFAFKRARQDEGSPILVIIDTKFTKVFCSGPSNIYQVHLILEKKTHLDFEIKTKERNKLGTEEYNTIINHIIRVRRLSDFLTIDALALLQSIK